MNDAAFNRGLLVLLRWFCIGAIVVVATTLSLRSFVAHLPKYQTPIAAVEAEQPVTEPTPAVLPLTLLPQAPAVSAWPAEVAPAKQAARVAKKIVPKARTPRPRERRSTRVAADPWQLKSFRYNPGAAGG